MFLTFIASTKYVYVVIVNDWTDIEVDVFFKYFLYFFILFQAYISMGYLLFYFLVFTIVMSYWKESQTTAGVIHGKP